MKVSVEHFAKDLNYDPASGVFTWKVDRGVARVGGVAGSYTARTGGYAYLTVNYRKAYAHRLAWAMTHGDWPAGEIDHINGIKTDNRICNLRLATHSQNMGNLRKHRGPFLKGVYRDNKYTKPWRAYVMANGKKRFLGNYATAEDAHAAYVEGAKKYHGEFWRAE